MSDDIPFGGAGLVQAAIARHGKRRREKPWNQCCDCGRFIAFEDFVRVPGQPYADRWLLTPDTAFTSEEFVTLCKRCNKPRKD